MSKVYLEDSTLTGIANAIRAKTGGSGTITPANMATEIGSIPGGGESFPNVVFSENLEYINHNNQYNWLFENYGNKVSTENVTSLSDAFSFNSKLEDLSNVTITLTNREYALRNTFYECQKLKKLPVFKNGLFSNFWNTFSNCAYLREIPDSFFDYCGLAQTPQFTMGFRSTFSTCNSLRRITSILLENLKLPGASYQYAQSFMNCWVLDEIKNLNVSGSNLTSNNFDNTITNCFRLKTFTFKTDNGTPIVANWKNQTIDFTKVGWHTNSSSADREITQKNSGITTDKKVTDATSYELLKNDPDWYTADIAYSRYNHDSAVATINSLPDTSAYLVTAGGTNTIKFKGDAGSATDGGAINTLTAAEIAVATNKGWTVTLV